MNSLMCVPNFSEDKLIFQIDNEEAERLLRVYDSGYNRLVYGVNFIVPNIDGSKLNYFDYCGIDISRFIDVEEIKEECSYREYNKEYKKTPINPEDPNHIYEPYKLVPTKKVFQFEISYKVYTIRKSIIQFLRFKSTKVPITKSNIRIEKSKYKNQKNLYSDVLEPTYCTISRAIYNKMVNEIESDFDYYTSVKTNSTFDEYITYEVDKLLSEDIKLKTIEELREERNKK